MGEKSSGRSWVGAAVALVMLSAGLPAATPALRADDTAPPGHIAAGSVLRHFQVAGVDGIPANATAVFANVTMTATDGAGFVDISDDFVTADTSLLNVTGRGRTAANLALLKLDDHGQIDVYASAGADVVIDAVASMTSDRDVQPLRARVMDSRLDPSGRLAPMSVRVVSLGGLVSPDAVVAVVNLTVTNPAGPGYTAVVPCSSTTAPSTSNLNVDMSDPTRSVLAFAPIEDGRFCVVSQSTSDLIVDLEGEMTAAAVQLIPGGVQRLIDTRSTTAFAAGESRTLRVTAESGGEPGDGAALLGNLTAVGMAGPGWASIGPVPSNGDFSTVNFDGARPTPNAFLAGLTDGSAVIQASQRGDLIVDGAAFLRTGAATVLASPVRILDTRLGNPPPPPNPLGSCAPGPAIAGIELPAGVKALAFTFDDGPDPVNTRIVMNAFRARGLEGKAMFMWVGVNVLAYPAAAAEVAARGYGIGSHSVTHRYSGSIIANEVEPNNSIIQAVTGQRPRFFRSPGLTRSSRIDAQMRSSGMCNIFTRSILGDFLVPRLSAAQLVINARNRIRNGDFVLLHDGGSHRQTADAIGAILDWAIAAGYQIVTPYELVRMGTPIPFTAGGSYD